MVQNAFAKDAPGPLEDRLDAVWECALQEDSGDVGLASWSYVLRNLLQRMKGTSEEAEAMRRYPTVWKLLNFLFSNLPLSRLARPLDDFGFHATLHRSIQAFSESLDESESVSSDHHPTNGKRKHGTAFTLDHLRSHDAALASAESMFLAVRALIHRVHSTRPADSDFESACRGYLLTSFSIPAAYVAVKINGLLHLCKKAFSRPGSDALDGEEMWVSTAFSLWDFRQQGVDDGLDAASTLSGVAFSLYHSLSSQNRVRSPLVQNYWRKDLAKFLIRLVFAPSKCEYDNRKETQLPAVLSAHLDPSTTLKHAFELLLDASVSLGKGKNTIPRDYYPWFRSFFSILEKPIRKLAQDEGRPIISEILASQGKGPELLEAIGSDSLREICQHYALGDSETHWPLVRRSFELPDVFLAGEAGKEILSDILQRVQSLPASKISACSIQMSAVISLAGNAFAEAGQLQEFLAKWIEWFSLADKGAVDGRPDRTRVWASALAQVEVHFRTTRQLKMALNWLESEGDGTKSRSVAILHVLAAIARSLRKRFSVGDSQFTSVVGSKLSDIATSKATTDLDLPTEAVACRWEIVGTTALWIGHRQPRPFSAARVEGCRVSGTPDRTEEEFFARSLWERTQEEMIGLLRSGELSNVVTFIAMMACIAWSDPWKNNPVAGLAVDELRKLMDRLSKDVRRVVNLNQEASFFGSDIPAPESSYLGNEGNLNAQVSPKSYIQAFFTVPMEDGSDVTDSAQYVFWCISAW